MLELNDLPNKSNDINSTMSALVTNENGLFSFHGLGPWACSHLKERSARVVVMMAVMKMMVVIMIVMKTVTMMTVMRM